MDRENALRAAALLRHLARLLELADLPTVSLQVLSFSAGAHAAMGSMFTIVRLPEPGGRVVYLEDLWSAEYADREPQVAAHNQVFDRLCTTALDAAETKTLIERAMGEFDDRPGGGRLA